MRAKRSNVCQVCRSRKLACDGKQPACSQCTLRKITCSGYQQEFIFVPSGQAPDTQYETTSCRKKAVKGVQTQLQPVKSHQSFSPTRSSRTTDPELEQDIQAIIQHYAPLNGSTPAASNPHHNQICGAWVEALPLVTAGISIKNFLLSAIKAYASAIRHHKSGKKSCQAQLLRMYGDSLALMRKALEQPQRASYIEHILAIMCLAVTDIMIPTSASGWMTHIKCVGDLTDRLGPEIFKSGIMHTIFVGFRPLLLISSILQGQSTFLEREEWTTIPFSGHPSTIMQLLLNEASKLPALLERYNEITNSDAIPDSATIEQLRRKFQDILQSFWDWEHMDQSTTPTPPFCPSPDPNNPSTMNLWFPNLMLATSLNHAWAFEIIATTHIIKLGGNIGNIEFPPPVLTQMLPHHQIDAQDSCEIFIAARADMICASMTYLMQPEMRLYGPGSAFFTLPTAVQVFRRMPEQYEEQIARCGRILDGLEGMGFHFPRVDRD